VDDLFWSRVARCNCRRTARFLGINGFRGLGLDTAGTVALVLGMLFTSALGAALMALVFYSDRSNADEGAYRAADGAGEGPSADRRTGDGDRP
jgi:hypothetical protein